MFLSGPFPISEVGGNKLGLRFTTGRGLDSKGQLFSRITAADSDDPVSGIQDFHPSARSLRVVSNRGDTVDFTEPFHKPFPFGRPMMFHAGYMVFFSGRFRVRGWPDRPRPIESRSTATL